MKVACVFAIDNDYVMPFKVFYHSLELTNSLPIDINIFILHTDSLSPDIIDNITDFLETYQRKVQFLDATHLIPSNLPIHEKDHVSLATFYRLFVAEILPLDIHQAVYLDVDMLAIRNASSLFMGELTDQIAAVDHFRPEEEVRLWGPEGSTYFQAGVLVIPVDRWRKDDIKSKFIQILKDNRNLIKWHDQDVLNIALHNSWTRLSAVYNMHAIAENLFPPGFASDNAKLIHFTGRKKPWNSFHSSQHDQQWDIAYSQVFGLPFNRTALKPSFPLALRKKVRAKLKGLYYGID